MRPPFHKAVAGALLCVVLAAGCQHAIGTQQAIAAAKEEARHRGWQEVEIWAARVEGGRWVVIVERIPKVWGGHAIVHISKRGKVLGFKPGL